jgi:16S rRNA (cytosine1402-N4)-methyltransferase
MFNEHLPVLLHESLDGLQVEQHPQGLFVDGTFGRGGHTREILARLSATGSVVAFDKDPQAIAAGNTLAAADKRLTMVHDSFANMKPVLLSLGHENGVNGILVDQGVSSPQLDDKSRGFSFSEDGPLDMRMNTESGITAAQWLTEVEESELATVLRELGEEKFAKKIARAVVHDAREGLINTTSDLASLVERVIPRREKHKHPATRTFQAIRIFINRELDDLKKFLEQARDCLLIGGRLVIISFHSLEDRLVKNFIRDEQKGRQDEMLPPDLPVPNVEFTPRMKAIGKPVRPSDEEVARNPRARSAIMRIAERVS